MEDTEPATATPAAKTPYVKKKITREPPRPAHKPLASLTAQLKNKKKFDKVIPEEVLVDIEDLLEDDTELWLFEAPSTFDRQLLDSKLIDLNDLEKFSVDTKNKDKTFELRESNASLLNCLINIFPARRDGTFRLGKPFSREFKVVQVDHSIIDNSQREGVPSVLIRKEVPQIEKFKTAIPAGPKDPVVFSAKAIPDKTPVSKGSKTPKGPSTVQTPSTTRRALSTASTPSDMSKKSATNTPKSKSAKLSDSDSDSESGYSDGPSIERTFFKTPSSDNKGSFNQHAFLASTGKRPALPDFDTSDSSDSDAPPAKRQKITPTPAKKKPSSFSSSSSSSDSDDSSSSDSDEPMKIKKKTTPVPPKKKKALSSSSSSSSSSSDEAPPPKKKPAPSPVTTLKKKTMSFSSSDSSSSSSDEAPPPKKKSAVIQKKKPVSSPSSSSSSSSSSDEAPPPKKQPVATPVSAKKKPVSFSSSSSSSSSSESSDDEPAFSSKKPNASPSITIFGSKKDSKDSKSNATSLKSPSHLPPSSHKGGK